MLTKENSEVLGITDLTESKKTIAKAQITQEIKDFKSEKAKKSTAMR